MGGIGREVAPFVRVDAEVEEFLGSVVGDRIAVLVCDHAVVFVGVNEGGMRPLGGRFFEERDKAATIEAQAIGGSARECEKRRIKVNTLDETLAHSRRFSRRVNEQRDAVSDMVNRVLAPQAVLGEVVAVVAPKDDDRVVRLAGFLERGEDAPDLRVRIRHAGEIALDEFASFVVSHAFVPFRGVLAHAGADVLLKHFALCALGQFR